MPTMASIAPAFMSSAVTLPTSVGLVGRIDDAQAQAPVEQAAVGVDLGLGELRAGDRRGAPDAGRAVDGNEQADDEIGAVGERFALGGGTAGARESERRRDLRAGVIADRRLGHRHSPWPARGSGEFASPRLFSLEIDFYNITA